MDYHMCWRHINMYCRLMCTYYAYVTIHRRLGVTCFGSLHFVNKVSGQHFSAVDKQEVVEFHYQHLPMHFRGVMWKIKSKSNFPVSFNLISADINLVGNYWTLRGLRTINPEGLPSTRRFQDRLTLTILHKSQNTVPELTAHWLSIVIALTVDGLRTRRLNTPSSSGIDCKRWSGHVISIKNLHSFWIWEWSYGKLVHDSCRMGC